MNTDPVMAVIILRHESVYVELATLYTVDNFRRHLIQHARLLYLEIGN